MRITAAVLGLVLLGPAPVQASPAQVAPEEVAVDVVARGTPFPHYWEKMFGSGRAILSLRESYRRDLREMKRVTGFGYVRPHGIFLDEVGVYDEDPKGKALYNFSYVDEIYDGLLEAGVRPFVELGFMPKKLAANQTKYPFWYEPVVAPPKSGARWDELITQFARHLVERYGIDEVSKWYFEVWNEPNIEFWAGEPRQATYFELYDRTARALKLVSPRLRVGGPATAQAAWVDRFIKHTVEAKVPVDFISTHVYANDTAHDVFGTEENIPRDQMVCRAVKKVHDEIAASARPALPLIWSEFNASWKNEPEITDTVFMGPWIADTVRRCDGLVDSMAFWTFSDVFEEQGVSKTPFYGGFGAIAAGGLKKASFHAFELLHRLGEERLPSPAENVLVTRRADGALVIAVWNLVLPGNKGAARAVRLHLRGLAAGAHRASIWRIDEQHGDVLTAYRKIGAPRYPSRAQLTELRRAAELMPPEERSVIGTDLDLLIPANGLQLIVVP